MYVRMYVCMYLLKNSKSSAIGEVVVLSPDLSDIQGIIIILGRWIYPALRVVKGLNPTQLKSGETTPWNEPENYWECKAIEMNCIMILFDSLDIVIRPYCVIGCILFPAPVDLVF